MPAVSRPRDVYNKDILARVAFVQDPEGIVIELASVHSLQRRRRQRASERFDSNSSDSAIQVGRRVDAPKP